MKKVISLAMVAVLVFSNFAFAKGSSSSSSSSSFSSGSRSSSSSFSSPSRSSSSSFSFSPSKVSAPAPAPAPRPAPAPVAAPAPKPAPAPVVAPKPAPVAPVVKAEAGKGSFTQTPNAKPVTPAVVAPPGVKVSSGNGAVGTKPKDFIPAPTAAINSPPDRASWRGYQVNTVYRTQPNYMYQSRGGINWTQWAIVGGIAYLILRDNKGNEISRQPARTCTDCHTDNHPK